MNGGKAFFIGCVLASAYYVWAGMPPLLSLPPARPALAGRATLATALPPPVPLTVAPGPAAPTPPPGPAPALTDGGPVGCPVRPAQGRVAMTQGYGVGSHAPAEIWGAVDLAVDGDGDGYADVAASWGAPIVATHDGAVTVTMGSWPAGNHVWVDAGEWRTGYSHLAEVSVVSGQLVRAGEQIGLLGSTGSSSGPHLDYQVWRGGVNIDPTGLVEPCF